MIGKFFLTGVFMASLTGVTMAADLATPSEINSDWTGLYLGAGGGYQWAGFDVDTESCTDNVCNADAGEVYSVNLSDQGFFGTLQAGADYQLGDSFVLGAMIDYSLGQELEDSSFNHVNYDAQNLDDGQRWGASLDGMLTVSARAGFLVTPRALIYGLAGWSWGKAEATAFEGCDYDGSGSVLCGASDVFAHNSEMLNGLTLGGGLEWAFADNFSTRLEYRYTDLGSINAHGSYQGPDSGGALYDVSTKTNVDVQSVRLTLNYRF